MTRVLWTILAVALLFPCAIVHAGKKNEAGQELIKKERKLEDVKKQIREEKKSVKAIAEKETSVLGELDGINQALSEKREELKNIEQKLAAVNSEISKANGNIARLEKERKDLLEKLKSRLKAMYRIRKGESVRVLLSSDTPSDLGRKHKYLTMIMDSDVKLISGCEENIRKLDEEKKKLNSLVSEMESVRAGALAKKSETESLQKDRVALLHDVKREKEKKLRTIKELEQAAGELTDLVNRLRAQAMEKDEPSPADEKSGFGSMRGKLLKPVEGKVVSFYGKVKHPKFQTVIFNNGIIIEAPTGAPVKCVYDGRVVYVGWLKGYGQVMIIDHKGGYYTLFAHLSKVMKEKGDEVKKGMEVALVGDTGLDSSPGGGLYFEVRQRGVPRDPMTWLAAK